MHFEDVQAWIAETHKLIPVNRSIPAKQKQPDVMDHQMDASPPTSDVHVIDDFEKTPTNDPSTKRRRIDTSSRPLDLRPRSLAHNVPSLQSASTRSTTRSGTTTSHRSRASKSPVKSVSDLRFSEKPVETLELDSLDQLPTDVAALFASIKTVCDGHNIVPLFAKQQFLSYLSLRDRGYSDASFYDADGWAISQGLEPWDAMRELEVFSEVVANTKECKRENFSEPAWNSRVHEPLLNFVLKCFTGHVRHYDVTRASIDKPYVPSLDASIDMQPKMVDFCLTLAGEDIKMASKQRNRVNNSRSINHTSYEPVRDRPIAVNIETKTPGSSSREAEAQLSVWTLGHLKRLRSLACTSSSTLSIDVTIPVIYVCGGDWVLYFVRDRADKMELIEVFSVGDTRTLAGCYKVASFLRHLGIWIHTVYREWVLKHVLTVESESDNSLRG